MSRLRTLMDHGLKTYEMDPIVVFRGDFLEWTACGVMIYRYYSSEVGDVYKLNPKFRRKLDESIGQCNFSR